jgi:RimJ/RimL family protein N-acetyltransferase
VAATPPLRTARLSLEPLRVEHADEMVGLLADRALYAFYDDEASPTLDELRARYARQALGRSADGTEVWHNWILREQTTGEVAGFVQATVRELDGAVTAELAWVVGTAYQGRGYATEAAAAARDAISGPGSRSGDDATVVQAHIAPGHVASESVARHLGLTPTSTVHDGETLWRTPTPA